MDNPYSCIVNVHVITTTSSFVSTPISPIFLDLDFSFRWSKRELIGMFDDLLAFIMEYVPLSITSIASYNASSVHIPLLVFGGIQFNCGVDFLLCGSRVGGRFSLLIVRSACCLQIQHAALSLIRDYKFMIVYLFPVPTSNNLVECVLAPPRVCLFFPYKQPKNPESVVNLQILL